MSFLKCCVGADPRPPPESIRPVGGAGALGGGPSARRAAARAAAAAGSSLRPDGLAGNKKFKLPNEVFFDPSKPDGQLSSVTDPPASARDLADLKKRKEKAAAAGGGAAAAKNEDGHDLEAPDNNGLTRGQNFMKVEKWLRNACMVQQIDITPATIANIEDTPVASGLGGQASAAAMADPPSEKDRIPPALLAHHAVNSSRAR